MKIKDLVSTTKNSTNLQSNWSLKKRKLKKLEISEEDILNMEVDKLLKKSLE